MGQQNALSAEKSAQLVSEAQAAIRLEAEGLLALADGLGAPFAELVELIAGCTGRVIMTGVGKSAHVAGKIAATLASTGTPAQFVHGADASHGDLGMITRADRVLMLSKSGETRELEDLANYCVRFDIPLVLVTQGLQSRLAKAAHLVVALPHATEACGITAAPTTSTTMMMALGDALAVVLLRRRGFRAQDFHVFHPGGSLGSALLSVAEAMHSGARLPVVAYDAPMDVAILEMTSKGFGCTAVTDAEGALKGVITDGDLRRHMGGDLLVRRAHEIMTVAPRTIEPGALLSEALRRMTDETPRISAIVVVENNRPVGIVHLHDCLRVGLV
jgi:arabinose-5-phosphate isomerase